MDEYTGLNPDTEAERSQNGPVITDMAGLGPDLVELERLLQIVPLTPLEHDFAGSVVTLTRELAAKAARSGGEVVHALPNLWDLTEREKEVLELIVEGRTNRDAARELRISPRTIEVHRASLRSKMQAETTAAMVTKVFMAERAQPNAASARLLAALGAMLRARLIDSIERSGVPGRPGKAGRGRVANGTRAVSRKAPVAALPEVPGR